jgi:hypothetical protein
MSISLKYKKDIVGFHEGFAKTFVETYNKLGKSRLAGGQK